MNFSEVKAHSIDGVFYLTMSTHPELAKKGRPLALVKSGSMTFSDNQVAFKGESYPLGLTLAENTPLTIIFTNHNSRVFNIERGVQTKKLENGDLFFQGENRNHGNKTKEEIAAKGTGYLTLKNRLFYHHRGVETSGAVLPKWAADKKTNWRLVWNILALLLQWTLQKSEDVGDTTTNWTPHIKSVAMLLTDDREVSAYRRTTLSAESTAIIERIRKVIVDSMNAHYATRGREAKLPLPKNLRDNAKYPANFSDLRYFIYRLDKYEKEEKVKVLVCGVAESDPETLLANYLKTELGKLKRHKEPLKALKALFTNIEETNWADGMGEVWMNGAKPWSGNLFNYIGKMLAVPPAEMGEISTRFQAVLKQRESKNSPYDKGWPKHIRIDEDTWQVSYDVRGKKTLREVLDNKVPHIQFTAPLDSINTGKAFRHTVTAVGDDFVVTPEFKPMTPGSCAAKRSLHGVSLTDGKGTDPFKLAVLVHRDDVDLNAKVKKVIVSFKTEKRKVVKYADQNGRNSGLAAPATKQVPQCYLNFCLAEVKTNEKYDTRGTGSAKLTLGWKLAKDDQLKIVTESLPTGQTNDYYLPLGEEWKTEGLFAEGCDSTKKGNVWSRKSGYTLAFRTLYGWPGEEAIKNAQKAELQAHFRTNTLTYNWLKTTLLSLPEQLDLLLNAAKDEGYKLMTEEQRNIVDAAGWRMVRQSGMVRYINELRIGAGTLTTTYNTNPSRQSEKSKPLGSNPELLRLWLRWLEFNDRLRTVERMVRENLLGRRKAYYYVLAHRICDHASTISYKKLNLKDASEKETRAKKKDKGDKMASDASQKYRSWASLAEFTTILKHVAFKRGVTVEEVVEALVDKALAASA